jgi:hypothetical protein
MQYISVCLMNLILADFFFFEKVNKELARLNLVQETIYEVLERVSRTVAEKNFDVAYRVDTNEDKSVVRSSMGSLRNSNK